MKLVLDELGRSRELVFFFIDDRFWRLLNYSVVLGVVYSEAADFFRDAYFSLERLLHTLQSRVESEVGPHCRSQSR